MLEKVKQISFIAIEAILYCVFIAMDLQGKDSTLVKYFGVVACFLFELSCVNCGKDSVFVCLALLFTLVADWFLLVVNERFVFGVCAFLVVQSIYFLRLTKEGVKPLRSALTRAFIIIVVMIVLSLLKLLDLLTALVAVYFVSLVSNTADAYTLFGKGVKSKLFAIGLSLFILCDLSVGFNNLSSYVEVSAISGFIKVASFAMWVFYLPSQVLIALSCKGDKNGKQ